MSLFKLLFSFLDYCIPRLGSAGAIVGIASGVNSLMGGGSTSGGNVAGGAYYDPYASYRGQAAGALNDLIYGKPGGGSKGTPLSYADWSKQQGSSGGGGGVNTTPGSIYNIANLGLTGGIANAAAQSYYAGGAGGSAADTSQAAYDKYTAGFGSGGGGSPMDQITAMPGYQFGMNQGAQTLNRNMAASGQSQSGAQQVALSQYGQQYAGSFYNNMVSQLSAMAGVGQTPLSMANQNALNAQQNQAGWQGIGQGFGALNASGLFGSYANSGGGFSSGNGVNPMSVGYTNQGVQMDTNSYGQGGFFQN